VRSSTARVFGIALASATLATLCAPYAHADLLVISGVDPGSRSVLRYDDATGAFLGAFVPPVSGGQISDPQGMVYGPDGMLYTSRAGQVGAGALPGGVARYDGLTGAFVDTFPM
jgi:hypothetical protein